MDVVVDTPLDELHVGGLAHPHHDDGIALMCLQAVAHTLGPEVRCAVDDAALGQRDAVDHALQHDTTHTLLHRFWCLQELVEVDDDRLSKVRT